MRTKDISAGSWRFFFFTLKEEEISFQNIRPKKNPKKKQTNKKISLPMLPVATAENAPGSRSTFERNHGNGQSAALERTGPPRHFPPRLFAFDGGQMDTRDKSKRLEEMSQDAQDPVE